MKGKNIQKITVHGLLNKGFVAHGVHTLWKCGVHEVRQEARTNNSLHITKSCGTCNHYGGCCNHYVGHCKCSRFRTNLRKKYAVH